MEKERLKHNIDRFDHYFESINNKTAVYIAINTFLTGGIIAIFNEDIISNCNLFSQITLGIALILGVISLIYLAYLSKPYTNYKPDSLYFFESISKLKKKEFIKQSKNYSEEDTLNDLRNQVYSLSLGLTKKYHKLSFVGYLLIAQFFLLIPTILIIIKN